MHPVHRAENFKPITAPFDEKTAIAEAERCLQCGCGNPRTCLLRKVT